MPEFDLIQRANAEYIERQYQRYQADPRSLDPQWQAFFAGFDAGTTRHSATPPPASCPTCQGLPCPLSFEVADLVHSYRELGHFIAQLDPLGHNRPNHPLLDLSNFGLSLDDLDRTVGGGGFVGPTDGTLRDLLNKLRATYCGTFAVEYLDIADKAQREWLQKRMEPVLNQPAIASDEAADILRQLVAAQGMEEFLHTKFIGAKRFSLEGAESFIPLLSTLIEQGAPLGVEEVVLGMAHRGRLNTLAHILHKPYEIIMAEFEGNVARQDGEGDGDVKYHLGYSHDRITASGRKVHLSLSFNPSHLELVNPVVEGIVRAKQYARGDDHRTTVVPVLIHGEAAFTGQGIVQETLALSEMPYWRTGGTIHIILNNQIGFTTMPKQGRFTPYPTDVARMIQAPIFHVNGDDPQAVVWAAKLAIAFRQQFHCDVLIDLWCYRRHGHNETDDPTFTQPLMYRQIASHKPVAELYAQRLIGQGTLTAQDFDQTKAELRQRLDHALVVARESRPRDTLRMLQGLWTGITRCGSDWSAQTAIDAPALRRIGQAATQVPQGFTVHPKLRRLLAARREMAEGRQPLDWGGAEMLALGSLVLEGTPVRFVGQDAQRGTFSHRHACLHDYENGQKYYPLANLSAQQAPIIIVNTMLSELAVLGFEYGFASADPRNLVVWEAQFGDFVNGAQAIIDQFIAAGESKWQKHCGLVMLLPHGYEGQGPEHSNAYMERFLALCAENNLQVVQPSIPSQYFHLLRRQMRRNFRKPLVAFMPKSLLRHEQSVSDLSELTHGGFQLVLDDPRAGARQEVRRLLLCSGKSYFSLDAARVRHGLHDLAIVRVEQLYPLPQRELQAIMARYHNAHEVGWVQEEPRNRGAWTYMEPRLRSLLPDSHVLSYYGREAAASPAVGSFRQHQIEEERIIGAALDLRGPRGAAAQATDAAGAQPARR
jgi:2-oxoglutarate dehydrogenase E1 component